MPLTRSENIYVKKKKKRKAVLSLLCACRGVVCVLETEKECRQPVWLFVNASTNGKRDFFCRQPQKETNHPTLKDFSKHKAKPSQITGDTANENQFLIYNLGNLLEGTRWTKRRFAAVLPMSCSELLKIDLFMCINVTKLSLKKSFVYLLLAHLINGH